MTAIVVNYINELNRKDSINKLQILGIMLKIFQKYT